MGDEEPDYGERELPEPEDDSPEVDPSDHDWEEGGTESQFIRWPRDPQVDLAKSEITAWFAEKPNGVFYGRQIEVIFEKKHFHWITHKALREMTREGVIMTELRVTPGSNKLRLYWSKRNRYPKRAASEIVKQVEEHSNPEMTRAIGHHAENLFAVAAGREGFRVYGPGLRHFGERTWYETEHDLDWIFERDGKAWGVEIKNTWAYIDREEMKIKIALCSALGIKPLFIMRWVPKSYVEFIRKGEGLGCCTRPSFFHSDTAEPWRNCKPYFCQ